MSKQESLTNKTFKGFFWTVGGKLTVAIVQIGVLAALARLIAPESFGLVQAALIVVGFAQLISKMGIGPALVQRKNLTEKHIRVGFTFSLLLGIILGIIIYTNAHFIASFFKIEGLSDVLKVVSLLFLTESTVTVSSSLIQRDMRLKERAIVEIFSYIFGYGCVGILLAYLGFDYWALIIAIFAQEIIKVIAYSILQKHSLRPMWSKKEFKELIHFGGGFTIAHFFNYLANQGDNIVIGKYLGAFSLGIYSRAYAIMVKPVGLVADALDKTLFPALSAKQGDKNAVKKAFLNGSMLITFICIPVTAVIGLSSQEIVSVMLGPGWEQVVIPLQILTAGLIFRMGYKMGSILTKSMGDIFKRALIEFLYAVLIILGSYFGSKWGITGVATGVLLAIVLNYIFMISLSLRILDINWVTFLKHSLGESWIAVGMSILYGLILIGSRSLFQKDILVLMTTLAIYSLITLILIKKYGRKLKFLSLIPKNKLLNKIL